ncbi:Hypothetical predicted protein [Lecanosticta acicola]|uniref:Tachykinin family protein n=1 Tax=Lecanosticta acicola TaxID=111012 RepID=A0AAI9ECZ9_9PEZI|nr:Hypothetical predicted protein [Lecanosticta acicola]
MPQPRASREPLSSSKPRSPPVSPNDECEDPLSRPSTAVAFVPFQLGPASGVGNDTRRAVRVQAAKASAAARKRTIARRLAERQSSSQDEIRPSSATAGAADRGGKLSTTSSDARPVDIGASPSPDRSLRFASSGRSDPSRSYPTKRWHPQIPSLVDYFLRYFAPEISFDASGREAFRSHLWPMALENTSLFHGILLTVASHASLSGALNVPMYLLAQLKHSTLESINEAVTSPETRGSIEDSVVGAIALLGGWELAYGDPNTYDTHIRGLETIINLRGGIFGSQSTQTCTRPLSPTIVNIVLQAGNVMALLSGKRPHFEEPHSPTPESWLEMGQSPGFAALRAQHLVLPSLLQTVDRLNAVELQDRNALSSLQAIKQSLTHSEASTSTKVTYSPHLTFLEDQMQRQTASHIQLAGLSLCEYMLLAAGSTTTTHEGPEYLHHEISQLRSEILLNTVYEEVALWSLFALCTVTGNCGPQHMRSLKRMQIEQELEDWTSCKALLEKYVYPARILDSRASALWKAVCASTIIARKGGNYGNRDGGGEPTIFRKGMAHPTTYLSRMIDAEES